MNHYIPFPRLLNASGGETRRIIPMFASINLSIVPLSTASIELMDGESIPARSWVEMYTAAGSAGIFRTNTPQRGYGKVGNSVQMEHGICEIGDYIVAADIEEESTARQAITKLMGYYRGNMWQLGTVASTDTVTLQVDHDNVLQAILTVMEQIPDCMLSFDQSSLPWTLNIVKRPSAVTAEGRLSRNIESVRIMEDDSELCTRVYLEGLPSGYMDASTIGTYGLVERQITGQDGMKTAAAQRMASLYLEKHKRPKKIIEIDAFDFSRVTGESLDALAIGKRYRLALPGDGVTEEEIITNLQYTDVYGDSSTVTVTLSGEDDTATLFLHRQSTGGSGTAKKVEKGFKKYQTKFEQTDHYFDLLATESQWDELAGEGHVTAYTEILMNSRSINLIAEAEDLNEAETKHKSLFRIAADQIDANVQSTQKHGEILRQAGLSINAETGALVYAEDNANNIGAKFKVQADNIASVIEKTGVDSLGSKETLYSKISQNAREIDLKVSAGDIASSINQTAQSVKISASKINLSGYVTASELEATNAKFDNLTSGSATAATLAANNMRASSFRLGSYYHHNSNITIEGVTYNIVTWGSSY